MPDLIVRDLEDTVVRRLSEEAARKGVSVEEAHRHLLRQALLKEGDGAVSSEASKGATDAEAEDSPYRNMTFKEMLLAMPDLGEDIWRQLEEERRNDPPRPAVDFE